MLTYTPKVNNSKFEALFPRVDRSILVESEFERQFITGVLTGSPVAWEGDPGTGKTEAIISACTKYNYAVQVVMCSLYDYSDLQGWPIISKESVEIEGKAYPSITFAPVPWVVNAAQAPPTGLIVFLDEINGGNPQQWLLANRIVHERKAGDVSFDPKRVAMMAAYNRPEVSTGGGEMTVPMATRFNLFKYEPSLEFFCHAYPSYFGRKPDLGFGEFQLDETAYAWARALVVGFLQKRASKDIFQSIPREESKRSQPNPCPRTWDKAARQVALVRQVGLPIEEALFAMTGCVGEPAMEAMTYFKDADLRDPEEVLREEIDSFHGTEDESKWKCDKPAVFKCDKRGDKIFALLAGIQSAVLGTLDGPDGRARYKACWRILRAAADQGGKDVAFAATQKFMGASAKITNTYPPITYELEPFTALLVNTGRLNKTKKKKS